MLRRRIGIFLVDLILLVSAILPAAALRDNLVLSQERIEGLAPYMLATLAVAILVIPISGLDRMVWRLSSFRDYTRVVWAIAAVVVGAVAITFAYNRLEDVSRSIPLLHFMLSVFALVGIRVLARARAQMRRSRKRMAAAEATGENVNDGARTVLIVGMNRLSELYAQSLQELAPNMVHLAGLVGRSDRHVGRLVGSHKVLGRPEDIDQIIRDLEIHGVFVDSIVVTEQPHNLSTEAHEALMRLEQSSDINIDFLAERMGFTAARHASRQSRIKPEMQDPSLSSCTSDALTALANRPYWKLKRALDFCAALFLLVLLAPVALGIGLLMLFNVGWPAVFWQVRPGRFGKPFKLYKFRTMLSAHTADGTRLPDEQRTSDIGEFVRRTRLDELPQLLNILAGHMSFVGPRPLLPVDQPEGYSARLLVRPGLTGWAQVVGGRAISATDKAMLDVWYVQNASLALDLRILLATIPMVLFGEKTDHNLIQRIRQETRQNKERQRAALKAA